MCGLSRRRRAGPGCARAAARMSLVDFAAPPAAARPGPLRRSERGPRQECLWCSWVLHQQRAPRELPLRVLLPRPSGRGPQRGCPWSTWRAGRLGGRSRRRGRRDGFGRRLSGRCLGGGRRRRFGGRTWRTPPPVFWARAAFRISSVESFFAICSSTRICATGSAGPPAIRCARRRPAGSAVPLRKNSVSLSAACPH